MGERAAEAAEFKSPCPAGDCDRTTPCRPPAPECPHPWHAASRARIAARLAAIRLRSEPEYAECTCGHYHSDHDSGVCGFAGCGCTHG